jgi:hypothetical protein
MDTMQLLRAELALGNMVNPDAEKALAVLQLATSNKEQKQRIRTALGEALQ